MRIINQSVNPCASRIDLKKVPGTAVTVSVQDDGYRVITGLIAVTQLGMHRNRLRLRIVTDETEVDGIR